MIGRVEAFEHVNPTSASAGGWTSQVVDSPERGWRSHDSISVLGEVMEIRFVIPSATVELELARDPATMSEDDLLWCFGGEIEILEQAGESPFRLCFEASLLGFLWDLANVTPLLGESPGVITDRYGEYSLELSLAGGELSVRDDYGRGGGATRLPAFRDAARKFGHELLAALLTALPGLNDSVAFRRFVADVTGRLERVKGVEA